jgi:DNA-binding MarR family transcriptional regulator
LRGATLKVLLLAFANWVPDLDGRGPGTLVPVNRAAQALRLSRATVSRAIKELCALGLLRLVEPGSRPLSQGGARGRAARYAVVTKSGLFGFSWKRPGDRNLGGSWRIDVALLRALLAALDPVAIKVLVEVHAVDRTRSGVPADNSGRRLSARGLGTVLRIGKSAAHQAINALRRLGQLEVVTDPAGRRARIVRFGEKAMTPPTARKQ